MESRRRSLLQALPIVLFGAEVAALVVVAVGLGMPVSDVGWEILILGLASVLFGFGTRALHLPDGRALGIKVSRLAAAAGGIGFFVASFLGLAYDGGPGRTDWIESPGLMVALMLQSAGILIVLLGLRMQRRDSAEAGRHAGLWVSLIGSTFGAVVLSYATLLVGYDVL